MLGAHQGAREVIQLAKQPQWRAQNVRVIPPPQRTIIDNITLFYFPIGYGGAIALVFAARGVRSLRERQRGMLTVSYPNRQVRVPKGLSVLEASLRFNVPHASVCGGRARCSTCRVRVVSDRGALPRPSGREAFVLARVGASADPSIRLACQLRPQSDIAVIPVLPPNVGADFVRGRHRINIGEERYIVSMFVDMRGSTKLAEARLPFDIVFLINRFVEAASQAVTDAGGQPNQFIGDGVLALFGLDVDPATACRQALRAAALVVVERRVFKSPVHHRSARTHQVRHRHTCRRSYRRRHRLSRSHRIHRARRLRQRRRAAAGHDEKPQLQSHRVGRSMQDRRHNSDALTRTAVAIRGHDEPMTVRTAEDPTLLASLIDPQSMPADLELSEAPA